MASQKNGYVRLMQQEINRLAGSYYKLIQFESIYFDRGFNSGGADAISDSDLDGSVVGDTNTNITASELGSGITMIQQLKNFVTNAAVVQGDYESTISNLRNDV